MFNIILRKNKTSFTLKLFWTFGCGAFLQVSKPERIFAYLATSLLALILGLVLRVQLFQS